MLTRLRGPRPFSAGFLSLLLLVALAQPARPEEGKVLTNGTIVALTQMKATPAEIVALIDRNVTQFDLSPASVKQLQDAGVAQEVLDAMWKATKKAATPLEVTAAVTRAGTEAAEQPKSPPVAKNAPPQKPTVPIKPHTPERLAEAKQVFTGSHDDPRYPKTPAFDEKCPLIKESSADGKATPRDPHYRVGLDWKSGSVFPSRVDHAGKYCFALSNVNNIFYGYTFTVNRLSPQGDDLSLLKGAVGSVKDFVSAPAPEQEVLRSSREAETPQCTWPLEDVKIKSSALDAALAKLDPGTDGNGKPNTVPLDTTLEAWKPVPDKFGEFENAVGGLIAELREYDAKRCAASPDELAPVEAAVLEGYVPARTHYLELFSRVKSQHVARYTAELDSTEGYDVVVQETLGGKPTTAAAKTYHLDPGRKILTASAGFVLTTLHARSYSSVTAPDPADPTMTKNVLGVDGGGGVRPALAALLNYHVACLLRCQVGLAISAGPLFDIANGKADTSHFGFFGGPSVHLWNRLYLTPGIHVGEFADYPLGFSQAGQPIPTGMGTPVARKRYTAHFAFGITFKASELGIGSGNSDSGKKTPATQPKP